MLFNFSFHIIISYKIIFMLLDDIKLCIQTLVCRYYFKYSEYFTYFISKGQKHYLFLEFLCLELAKNII